MAQATTINGQNIILATGLNNQEGIPAVAIFSSEHDMGWGEIGAMGFIDQSELTPEQLAIAQANGQRFA